MGLERRQCKTESIHRERNFHADKEVETVRACKAKHCQGENSVSTDFIKLLNST